MPAHGVYMPLLQSQHYAAAYLDWIWVGFPPQEHLGKQKKQCIVQDASFGFWQQTTRQQRAGFFANAGIAGGVASMDGFLEVHIQHSPRSQHPHSLTAQQNCQLLIIEHPV